MIIIFCESSATSEIMLFIRGLLEALLCFMNIHIFIKVDFIRMNIKTIKSLKDCFFLIANKCNILLYFQFNLITKYTQRFINQALSK